MDGIQDIGNTRIDAARCRWLTGLLLVAAAAMAQDADLPLAEDAEPDARRYAVELILFTYTDEVSSGGEVFPPEEPEGLAAEDDSLLAGDSERETGNPEPGARADDAVAVFGDRLPTEEDATETELGEIVLPTDIELTVLSREELTLKTEYDRLVQLDAYRPVLWTGWSQETFARDVTPVIRLRRLGRVPLSFNGTLQLYLSRFLHLVVDLSLDAPRAGRAAPAYGDARRDYDNSYSGAAAGPVRYQIHEDRIFKNGDLRYFDHPKFGLLARVTRIEPSEPGDEPGDEPLPTPVNR